MTDPDARSDAELAVAMQEARWPLVLAVSMVVYLVCLVAGLLIF